MLPYFFISELNLNQEYLNAVVANTVKNVVGRNDISTNFKINVSDHQALIDFKDSCPLVSDVINVYVSKAGGGIPPHQDAARKCAINFPIKDTEDSSTIFYEAIGEPEYKFNKTFVWNTPVNEIREVFRFTLVEPIIINNSLIHSVEHRGERCRIIASWSVLPQYTFEDVVEFFKSRQGVVG